MVLVYKKIVKENVDFCWKKTDIKIDRTDAYHKLFTKNIHGLIDLHLFRHKVIVKLSNHSTTLFFSSVPYIVLLRVVESVNSILHALQQIVQLDNRMLDNNPVTSCSDGNVGLYGIRLKKIS